MSVTESTGRKDFWWLHGLLGVVFASLAIIRLAQFCLVTGHVAVALQSIVDAYDDGMRFALGWTEPYLRPLLHRLGEAFGWNISLYPHWKHILILSLVYWSAFVRSFAGGWSVPHALRYISIGVLSSVAAAICAGAIPLGSKNFLLEGLIAAIPVVALHLGYGIAYLWPRRGIRWMLANIVSAAEYGLVGFGFTGLFWSTGFRSPGLVAAGSTYILLATNFFAGDIGRREFPRLGLIMLGGFAGALLFFGINVGLKLAGQ